MRNGVVKLTVVLTLTISREQGVAHEFDEMALKKKTVYKLASPIFKSFHCGFFSR